MEIKNNTYECNVRYIKHSQSLYYQKQIYVFLLIFMDM